MTAAITAPNWVGGILGHGTNSDITISGCVVNGSIYTDGYFSHRQIGVFIGWCDNGGTKECIDCLYVMSDDQNTTNLDLYRGDGTVTITHCYKTTAAGSEGSPAMSTTAAPDDLGDLVHDYGMVKAYQNGILYNGMYYVPPTLNGSGTEQDPYTISSDDEWNIFAILVNSGTNNFSGKFVKLTKDIEVSTMVGVWSDTESERCAFSGTFDGDGNTITATITDEDNQGIALFRYINNATIKNLKVAGTITSNQYHASGLVGFSKGTNNSIEDCVVTASVSGSKYVGGIVGHALDSNIDISGCVYSGLMTGGSNYTGVFVGWGNSGTRTVTDCLYIMADGQSTSNFDLVKDDGCTLNISRCYKTTNAGSQGTLALVSNTDPGNLGDLVQDYGLVKAYANGILSDGTYYVARVLVGSGTNIDPYTISTTVEWDIFAYLINNGTNSFSGQFLKLMADISVTTKCGTVSGSTQENAFSGTFDGNGKTITATITDNDNQGAALFCYINGATIKNLKVAGTITSNQRHVAGLVGFAKGTCSIENSVVTTTVDGSNSSDGYVGGIVGHALDANISISGCVFSGLMTGGGTAKGAIFGWGDDGGTKSVTDCLYIMADGQNTTGLDLVRKHAGDVSVTNSYKTTGIGTYGTQGYALAAAPANLGAAGTNYGMVKAYANGILYGGTYYGLPTAAISLANNSDNTATISGAVGYVAAVTLNGRTLYKDGAWNTICLPFNVNLTGSPLEGATARTLTSASISGSTLNLTFGDEVSTLVAGTPYIIKWERASDYVDDNAHNIVNPVFSGVTISTDKHDYDTSEHTTAQTIGNVTYPAVNTDTRVRFLGTYKSTAFDATDNTVLLLGGANTLYYPTTGAGLGAQRAYFKLGDGEALARQLTAFNIDFGDESTGIVTISKESGSEGVATGWYTLDGRRLDGKLSRAGVYINNGIKVVIK